MATIQCLTFGYIRNIPLPKSLQTDDENDQLQLEHFLGLIEISKGAGRIMQLSPGPAGLCAHSIVSDLHIP